MPKSISPRETARERWTRDCCVAGSPTLHGDARGCSGYCCRSAQGSMPSSPPRGGGSEAFVVRPCSPAQGQHCRWRVVVYRRPRYPCRADRRSGLQGADVQQDIHNGSKGQYILRTQNTLNGAASPLSRCRASTPAARTGEPERSTRHNGTDLSSRRRRGPCLGPDLHAAEMIGCYLFLTPRLDSKGGGVSRLVTNAFPRTAEGRAIGGRVPGPSGPGVFCEHREPRLRPTRGRPQPTQP